MQKDGRTDGRTHGRHQNYIPPTLSGDNNNKRMIHSSVSKRLPSPNEIMYCSLNHEAVRAAPSADPEGGGGSDPL